MIAAFDATVLMYLFDANANAPQDADTGEPVSQCQARVSHLIAELQRAKAKIIIPAPALAEVLVYGKREAPDWLRILSTSKHFRIAPFDQLAAVEFAEMERLRLASAPKRSQAEHRKAKFDEQIVGIARAEQVDVIYSDDSDIRKLAGDRMEVRGIAELPLPPSAAQLSIEFEQLEEAPPQQPEEDR